MLRRVVWVKFTNVSEVLARRYYHHGNEYAYHPDDGENQHLRNVGKLLEYTAQNPRRQPSL
jgi:hypothetical protein